MAWLERVRPTWTPPPSYSLTSIIKLTNPILTIVSLALVRLPCRPVRWQRGLLDPPPLSHARHHPH